MSNQAETPEPEASSANKKLVRILVLIGIGIPILIEAITLFRLIGGHMDEESASAAPDTSAAQVVNVGDELLPATPPAEVIAELIVEPNPAAGTWVFEMEVEVRNATGHPYTLEVSALETQDGTRQRQQFSQRWAPGDEGELEAEWSLPEGQLPRSLTARGRLHVTADSVREATRRVELGRVPVQWRREGRGGGS